MAERQRRESKMEGFVAVEIREGEKPVTHSLNCAKLAHRALGGTNPCSCGAEPREPDAVHNHGPEEGPGLECNEQWVLGKLVGECISGKYPGYSMLDEHHGEPATGPSVDSENLGGTLMGWWVRKAQEEAETVVPKATEYGGNNRAADLTQIGRSMVELMAGAADFADTGDEGELQELACYFYLQGKMGRWHAALMEGRRVSDDTIYDIGIYIKMVQRIREAGGWPV